MMEGGHRCELLRDRSECGIPKLPPGRHIGATFLRNFKKLTLIYDKYPETKFYLRSKAAILAQKKMQANSPYWYILHPFSRIRLWWNNLMTVVCGVSFIVSPWNSSFGLCYGERTLPLIIISMTLDCLFITDLILCFFTGYYEFKTKILVLEPKKIFVNLNKSVLCINIITSLPYSICPYYLVKNNYILNWAGWMQIMEFTRIIHYLHFCVTMNDIMSEFVSSIIFTKVADSLIFTILLIHWLTCLTILQPQITSQIYDNTWNTSWLVQLNITKGTLYEQYSSLGLEVTVALLGVIPSYFTFQTNSNFTLYANVDEVFVRAIICVLGLLIRMNTLVLFFDIINLRTQRQKEFRKCLVDLNTFIKRHHLESTTCKRLEMYYHYQNNRGNFMESTINATLTYKLRNEIYTHDCRRLIEKSRPLIHLKKKFILLLMDVLECVIFLPNDVIINYGDKALCMYFIKYGTATVYTGNGKRMYVVNDGDTVGEISLVRNLTQEKYIMTVIADTIVEAYRLSKQNFKEIIIRDPIALATCITHATNKAITELNLTDLHSIIKYFKSNKD